MDKPLESTKGGRKSTVEKLPPLNLSPPKGPEGSQPAKDKQLAVGQEPQDSAVALERIEKDDGEGGVFKGTRKAKELTPGEKETVIKGRGLILTEDKEGYEFMYDMLTGLRATKDYRSVKINPSDFEIFHDLRFPSNGSSLTPPHMQRDFKFADYAPLVFARIREAFGIDPADYLDSLAKEYNLSCVRSPGKSGSVFYYSADGRFMIKTITQSECHFLQSILPAYYGHVISHPDTLITRFLGLHRVKPHKDKKAYIVVMFNVLYSAYFDIDELYDLKGSTVGRAATGDANAPKKRGVVYKDLDFTRGFELGPVKAKILMDALKADCRFLESQNIMDYSLLLGVHTLTEADLKVDPRRPDIPPTPRASVRSRPTVSYRSIFSHDWGGLRSTDSLNQPTNVIYFIGVIDILQEYNVRKKLEHGFKSLKYDSDKISAVSASLYAQRFVNYMKERIRTVPGVPRPVVPPSPVRSPAPAPALAGAPQRPVSKLSVVVDAKPAPADEVARKEKKEKKKARQAAAAEADGKARQPQAEKETEAQGEKEKEMEKEKDGLADGGGAHSGKKERKNRHKDKHTKETEAQDSKQAATPEVKTP